MFAEFDDTVAYTKYLQPYTEYFASLAVMGLTLMVEAYHQRGDVKGAEAALDDLWTDIRTIYQPGGSPVTDGNIVYQIPTKIAWTRKPVCFTAGFDSTQADAFNENPPADADPAQVALATNTSLVASLPAAGQDGWNTPSYVYAKGDTVCAALTFELAPPPDAFMPALIADNAYLAQAAVSRSGAGWRDPGKPDFTALIAGTGDGSVDLDVLVKDPECWSARPSTWGCPPVAAPPDWTSCGRPPHRRRPGAGEHRRRGSPPTSRSSCSSGWPGTRTACNGSRLPPSRPPGRGPRAGRPR